MFTMLMIMFGVFNIFYFVGQFGELAATVMVQRLE